VDARDRILVTGSGGLVGSAVVRRLEALGYQNIFGISRKECDLRATSDVLNLFRDINPDYVFHTAAKVYGIGGNQKNKALSFYDNVMINTNVIDACHKTNVKKVVAMGTVAAYPGVPPEGVLREDMIFSGRPHASEDSYGFAKRAMLAMLLAYEESYNLSWAYVISNNVYGPGDNFNTDTGHVVPSLLKKFYDAKLSDTDVVIWGDGSAQRNFIYVDDLVKGLLLVAEKLDGTINIGTNEIISIKYLSNIIFKESNFNNNIIWDTTKPNGRKFISCDLTKLNQLGFKPDFNINTGIKLTYAWLKENYTNIKLQ
jgi:GDP-L-fucose synthase